MSHVGSVITHLCFDPATQQCPYCRIQNSPGLTVSLRQSGLCGAGLLRPSSRPRIQAARSGGARASAAPHTLLSPEQRVAEPAEDATLAASAIAMAAVNFVLSSPFLLSLLFGALYSAADIEEVRARLGDSPRLILGA